MEDLKRFQNKSGQNTNYQKLVELSRPRELIEKEVLHYYISGLMNEHLVNFKISLECDSLSDQEIERIISYIHHGITFRTYQVSSLLSSGDYLNVKSFRKLETSQSRTAGSFLLVKDNDAHNFLLELIADSPVYLVETGERARVGEELKPALFLSGTEDLININIKEDEYQLYRAPYHEVYWTVIDSIVHPINMVEFNSLPDEIRIPGDKKGEFIFEVLPALEKKYGLEIDNYFRKYELHSEEPVITLYFDYIQGNILCNADIEIKGEHISGIEALGRDFDLREYTRSSKGSNLWYLQDNQAVKDLLNLMHDYGFHVRPEEFILRNKEDIIDFITDGFIHLPEEWQLVTTDSFDELEIRTVQLEPIIELKEGDGIDWFEFEVYYNLGGKTFTSSELKKMISQNQHGESYINIDRRYFILQEGQQEEGLTKLLDTAEEGDEGDYRSSFYNLLYYKNLIEEAGIRCRGNRVYNSLQEDITAGSLVKEVSIPQGVQDVLRNYQRQGYYWLRFLNKYHFGGILADDMGLGKTIQTLTLLVSLELNKPALVICPRTLIYNWAEEVDKFFPDLKYLVYYGTPEERNEMLDDLQEYELLITSYSIISRDYEKLNNNGLEFAYCILDEAHHIKNHRTKRAQGVKKIKAERKLALTGTPLENSIDELWSIFDFLMPAYLYRYSRFKKEYLNPITKGNDQEKLQEFKKRVAPFILRRNKDEVLKELPEKTINIQYVEMTKLQEDTYQLILDQLKGELLASVQEKGFDRSRINILAALTRLRQVCNHPSLVLNNFEHSAHKEGSGKLAALSEIVQEAVDGGHKIIVFSQFVRMLKIIREDFEKRGVSFEYLDGSTRDRMSRVKSFNQDDRIKAFLISLKAGGIGLNLTAADIVIHVDPWWNPMVERQATDRAHRLGQENRVMVYKLITKGTVEEKMIKLQRRKEDMFNNIVEDNVNPLNQITWEDIQELLDI
ncbi:SNF2-related protein [Halocella sp. SP3-1]|uniref:DEAD/DEAH box helicase n=1 Tax=Halocella sp. SP3-1 TaxID=2382161 RepID=UPI000F75B398|nr:SNF2-related protein [Halocella sp. SP3-1]AZO93408.1 helicase SNF2 [Halocella sp. SP3-1]